MGLEQAFDPNTIDVLAFHGAPGAPAVDINDVFEDPILNSFDYGGFAGYFQLPPENYFLEVRPTGSEGLVGTFSINLTNCAGLSLVLFASGIPGGDPAFGLFAALPDGSVVRLTPVALTQVIHTAWGKPSVPFTSAANRPASMRKLSMPAACSRGCIPTA